MHPQELERLLRDAGVVATVPAGATERVERFLELRLRWSGAHNVSGPRALAEAWHVDVLDGFAVAAVLAPELPLWDVGSGSGVPGLIVAVVEPERTVTLVEPIAKRAALLRTAARALDLPNLRIVRDRWPVPLELPGQVVSRAVVSPSEWPALAVSAGPSVQSFVRMLAAERPPVSIAGFQLAGAVDYRSARAERRVERWVRS
jgi:16S rRNA G527 N7-methylase RsmG